MQQLTFVAARRLEWREVQRPTLTSDQSALVEPLAVARCDLDFYIANGQYRTPGPFALGHEIAGEVLAVGSKVTDVRPGDRVIVPFQINCGHCGNCRRGWTNACESVPPCAAYGLGTHPEGDFGGGFSDCILVPFADAMLMPIPPGMSMAAACGLSDNVADGYRTVAPWLKAFPQQPVLVVGGLAQSVGLYAVQAALALGASQVVYVDDNTHRLRLARQLGAQVANVDFARQTQFSESFLITVDANCTPAGMAYAIRSTAACGYCTSVSGGLSPTTALPLAEAYLKGINYQVSRVHGRATLPPVLEHVCNDSIDPLAFATKPLPISAAADAMFEPACKLIFSREPTCQ